VAFSPDLFREEAERALHQQLARLVPEISDRERKEDFQGLLEVLSGLAPAVDSYFDAVMVMCDDEAIRNNRMNFLSCLFALFSRYAVFFHIADTA